MAIAQTPNNVIKIANTPLDGYDRTYLTSDVPIGEVDVSVISTSGDNFKTSGDDYYILIGDYGDEKAEIVLATADSCTTVLFKTAALSYSHSASDPITFIPYNQIKIIGLAASGDTPNLDNTVATIDIDTTKQYTTYTYTGSTYSFFVTAYFNNSSGDGTISAYSEEIGSSSFGRNSAKRIIESGLRKAQTSIDDNEGGLLNWDDAISILNDGLDEIMTTKKQWQFLHTIDSTTYDTVASTNYISIPSDLSILEFLIIDDLKLSWISKLDYDFYTKSGTTPVSTGKPCYYTIKNEKYYLFPTPDAAYDVTYEYYKYPTQITDLTDDVDRAFASILMVYCAYQFASIRGNEKKATELYGQFEKILERQRIQYCGPSQVGDGESAEQTNTNNWE